MGFWDDDKKMPDFSSFGIMANTPGPTPDAFLVKEIADQNTYNNPFGFGGSSTYSPTSYYYDDDDDE